MSLNYKKIAKSIIDAVGKENISSAEFCATRLRLIVNNRENINDSDIKNIDGVKGVLFNSGQYQIILGTGVVNKVYNELSKLLNNEESVNKYDFKRIIRMFSDIFVPIMPVIIASGLFIGFKNILINERILVFFNLKLSDAAAFSDILTKTVFIFLPALICWSAFKVFGGSPIIGIVLGLIIVSLSNIVSLHDINKNCVLPALVSGIIGSKLELKIRNIIPNIIDILATPFLTLLIMSLLSFFIIIPVFSIAEKYIIIVLNLFLSLPFGIGGFIFAFGIIFMVINGVHHIINFLEISLLAATSLNPINPLISVANLSAGAVCLAITLKTNRKSIKSIGYNASLSACLGITESAIFGVNIRYGIRPIICGAIAAGISGIFVRIFNLQAAANGVTGIPAALLYIYDSKQFFVYISTAIVTVILSFIITWFFGVPKEYMQED
ncbi:PTS transporter subunit EIIC [uncultured Brachyspira sp.]|uniref:PTS transporter subunit EIIC n=1 Tax=uncultured Brachyspira sp. TaxID=221953 RepID=UPI002635C3A2|nr:PTS transporter subunit EIIC [uncultured Brachyspira sp.]